MSHDRTRDPLFHKAHYNILAKLIRTMKEELTGTDSPGENAMAFLANVTLDAVAKRMAMRFAQDNPRFEVAEFLEACNVVDEFEEEEE